MNVCIFCGSSSGRSEVYASAAKEIAKGLIQSNSTLIYGGGNIGLMGIIADEMISHHGKVIGIIPDFLVQKEVAHRGVTELEVVKSMHDRKKRMADLAHVFIALPGGWGTLDELAEILTWKQLGLIDQPIGLLNTNSYFTPLVNQMNVMVSEGFLAADNLKNLVIEESPQKLLTLLGVVAV